MAGNNDSANDDPIYGHLKEYRGDTSICRKCGNCCKVFSQYIPTQEAWRLRNLVGLKLKFYDIGEGMSRVVFEYPCRFLEEENGFFTCRIHEDIEGHAIRPLLCKSYPQSFIENKPDILLQEIEQCPIIAASMGDQS